MTETYYAVEAYPGLFYIYQHGNPKPFVKGLTKSSADRMVETLNAE